jgi:hypothetical protein
MMRGVSDPPPGSAPPPTSSAPPASSQAFLLELEAPSSGFKRLLGGRKGPMYVSLAPSEIVIEHAQYLKAPLRFAPGAVAVATVDRGPAQVPRDADVGRFPILHRLATGKPVPREEGIEGWVWTTRDGSALATLCGDDAPNVALLFVPPLGGAPVVEAFEPDELEKIAKRSPLGEPALFGLLLRVADVEAARVQLDRLGLIGAVTDREIPPTQRRHLPGDKPANPTVTGVQSAGTESSKPPPGF